MAVLQAVPSVNDQDNPDPDAQRLQALAQSMAKDETHLLYSMCLNGRNELAWAPDEYSALVMVLLRFFVFKSSDSSTASPALEKKTLKTPEVVTPSETKPITAPVAKQNNVPVAAVVAPSVAPSIRRLQCLLHPNWASFGTIRC
jgi:DNA polymerase-3 subunit gamma/tau